MKAVLDILAAYGYDDPLTLSYNDLIEVEVGEAMMPLAIEKVGETRISVAHYYTRMGDLMYDPEVVFDVSGKCWVPVRYTQHPRIEQYDPNGLDLSGFVETWDDNIRSQGYVKAAQNNGGGE